MDVALENGDFKVDTRGYPIQISGIEEKLQQVLIRLLVKKGSFRYDESLGSNLSSLKASYISDGSLKQRVLDCIKEALKPMPEIKVLDLDLNLTDYYEKLRIDIKLAIDEITTSVNLEI